MSRPRLLAAHIGDKPRYPGGVTGQVGVQGERDVRLAQERKGGV